MRIGGRRLLASSICFASLPAVLYACSGDDTANNGNDSGADGSAGDGTVSDAGSGDRQVTDSASTDSGGGDAQSDVFLPNQELICGGVSCDFASSACCTWGNDDGGNGGQCLPLSAYDGGPLPCAALGQVIGETTCFRATDCSDSGNCQIYPFEGTIFGTCRDSGAGGNVFACDPAHPCDADHRCQRVICGLNEVAICLQFDAGVIPFCTEVP